MKLRKKIRELSSKVPIVAMTADVIQGVREKCGAERYTLLYQQPLGDLDQFLQTIKDILLGNELLGKPCSGIQTVPRPAAGLTGIRGGNEELLNHQVLVAYYHENQDTLDKT